MVIEFIKPYNFSLSQKKSKYNEIYNEMNDLLKKYNFCNIHKNEEGILVCNRVKDFTEQLCCGGCEHQTSKGCKVKALSCKLWVCYEAIELFCNTHSKEDIIYFFGMKEYLHQLQRIHGIPAYGRTSKKDNFKNKY